MSTVIIALGATVAAGVLTWFLCVRPMRRSEGAPGPSCCAPAEATVQDQVRDARKELAQLQAAAHTPAPEALLPPRHEP